VPVPVKATVVGEAEASVTMEMLPETLAVEVGAKVALKVMVLPGARVTAEKPVTPNCAPVTLSDETFKFAVPVFFKVIACVAVVPSGTLPKLTLEGVTETPAWVPVPLNATVRVGLEASLAMTRLPAEVAADMGAN
jgi:hypothetical protein